MDEVQVHVRGTTASHPAYKAYVLFLLLFAYLLNQLDRYMTSIVTKPMAQDVHYGDLTCMVNSTKNEHAVACVNITSQHR